MAQKLKLEVEAAALELEFQSQMEPERLAKAKAAEVTARKAAEQRELVSLAHEAATLASEVGVAEVSGNAVPPAKKARLSELQARFTEAGKADIVAAITARNGTQIARIVEGW